MSAPPAGPTSAASQTGGGNAELAFVDASTTVLEGLSAAHHPIGVVNQSLTGLAGALGVERAIVAIDDAVYGRQVFCSGRRPIGVDGTGLWGPPGVITEPERVLDDRLARLIVAAVGTAFERARSAKPPAVTTSREVARPDVLAPLSVATQRSARYGWGFTLVLVRFDEPDEATRDRVAAHLRSSDTVIDAGGDDLGVLLPAAAGDEVPRILTRVAQGAAASTFCYGLAACPGDASEPGALLVLATQRLREADKARLPGEIPAAEPPEV